MKAKFYPVIAIAAIAMCTQKAAAQTWRGRHAGLPASFSAGNVYGEGSKLFISNLSPVTDAQMYYSHDTAAPCTGSSSVLGTSAAIMTSVVASHGKHFVAGIGGVFVSTDDGVSWNSTGASSVQYTFALYACNDTLYAFMGNSGQLPYYSTNDGATWTLLPNYTGSQINRFIKYNGVLYAGGSSSLQYTADMGATWHTLSSPASLGTQNITGFTVYRGAVYASSTLGVHKTTDDGATWTNMTTTPMNCMTSVDSSIICGTSTRGVYQSNQAADTWTQIATGLPVYIGTVLNSIKSISYNSYFVVVAVSNSDSAVYVMKLSDLGLTTSTLQTATVAAPSRFAMMPNPAAHTVTIDNRISEGKAATVVITDMTGRTVKMTANTTNAMITMDISDVPQGMYLVQLTTDSGKYTQKLEVVR